jgi:hypothetical protein
MKKMLLYGFVLTLLSLGACSYYRTDEVMPCAGLPTDRNISYNLDISPIIQTTCALSNCHVAGFENGDFTNFDEIKKKADSGLLEQMITTGKMPQADTQGPKSLTNCQIELLKRWIREGGVNN